MIWSFSLKRLTSHLVALISWLLYNSVFKFFTEKGLISHSQSDSKPGNLCTNQLLSITHQIYEPFDDIQVVRSVFLDKSKAFYFQIKAVI